jgi:hypothetical protein
MNKEEIIKEVITLLDTSNYVDPAEHIYDGLKQIKRKITYATVHDFLWALESSTVGDFDGKVAECANKIKRLLTDMTIDEAYEKYQTEMMFHPEDNWLEELDGMDMSTGEIKKVYRQYALKEFINKCKTDSDFSETWGLKIEERELSDEESVFHYEKELYSPLRIIDQKIPVVPTKLITITYNKKTIETYE